MKHLSLLSLLLLLPACRTVPWSCTADTCAHLATADLPRAALGKWRQPGGDVLQLALFREERGGAEVASAGLFVHRDAGGTVSTLQAYSFDGRRIVAEERIGEGSRSPRRFHSATLEGEELVLRPLRVEFLIPPPGSDDFRIAPDAPNALVYQDPEPMARLLQELLADPTRWGPGERYSRVTM